MNKEVRARIAGIASARARVPAFAVVVRLLLLLLLLFFLAFAGLAFAATQRFRHVLQTSLLQRQSSVKCQNNDNFVLE